MSVTSLGGADGMLFRFGAEQTASFWMKDTVLPLSIAFFADDGAFVSATDMEPCPPGTSLPASYYGATGRTPTRSRCRRASWARSASGPASRLAVTDRACAPSG